MRRRHPLRERVNGREHFGGDDDADDVRRLRHGQSMARLGSRCKRNFARRRRPCDTARVDQRDDTNTALTVVGITALTGIAAWLLWPKATAPVPPLGYVPQSPRAPSEAPVTMPAFLAAAPPVGAARERYFEAAVDAPTWSEVVLSPNVKIRVANDYLTAQGVHIPLWPSTAQRIADRFDAILPTKALVDAIWRAATVKIEPHPMSYAPLSGDDVRIIAQHEAIVDSQVTGREGLRDGGFKSIVVGRTLATPAGAGKVCIFGWHRANGVPIQPVYCSHSARFSDYSHGTRLVSRTAYLNGQSVAIESLFADPRYAPLLNESGTLTPAQLAYPRS